MQLIFFGEGRDIMAGLIVYVIQGYNIPRINVYTTQFMKKSTL